MDKHKKEKGFTLIEVLVVIGIIAVLAAVVIVAINPSKQFAQARNSQRTSNVATILNAIGQRLADNKGVFTGSFTIGTDTYNCPTLVAGTTYGITSASDAGNINMTCLTPTYIPAQIPVDPNGGTWTNSSNYNTNYTIVVDSVGRYKVCAPNAATETSLPSPASICIER